MIHDTPQLKRLLVVTDAWRPQVNGVVQTYLWLQRELPQLGVEVEFLTPQAFRTFPMPTYPEIRLSWTSTKRVGAIMEAARADMIHIATEGPLGWHARRYCLQHRLPFTTCYHTRYPEYIAARIPIPQALSYAVVRQFHKAAATVMVATPQLREELQQRGFGNARHWLRGIDTQLFAHGPLAEFDFPKPWFLFVGRLAVEKNIEEFLKLDLPGSKILVGDGPARAMLQRRYPQAHFLGSRYGQDLASIYRAADVFVFPSLTDTFGLVMAEALAAGTPVAAYPGAGAKAIFKDTACGVLSNDLREAAIAALAIDPAICRQTGALHSIRTSAEAFLSIVSQAMRTSH